MKEEHCPFTETFIPAERQDCDKDDEDEKCYPIRTMVHCSGSGKYYSKYKIIKVLKGKYDKDTIEFFSMYCSEFSYHYPLNEKYVVLGVIKDHNNESWQNYISRIYLKKNKWILPYKKDYPFIHSKSVSLQKLSRSQRVKIKMDEEFFFQNNFYSSVFPEPQYKRRKKYAHTIYGFILDNHQNKF
ncbi:hypothetical protein ACFQO9_19920 [Chryseobacterium zhengzhouense]|uniref:Uncharacterized protein n=1 Tax=Chryseobacterium zhengzhouense TaxID=1636086 RepID=A0ABW2M634_9FLAO